MTKSKIVDLNEILNIIFESFFIWIRLESQISISKSGGVNTKGIFL